MLLIRNQQERTSTYPEFVFEVQIDANGVYDVRIRGFDYNTMKNRFKDNLSGIDILHMAKARGFSVLNTILPN